MERPIGFSQQRHMLCEKCDRQWAAGLLETNAHLSTSVRVSLWAGLPGARTEAEFEVIYHIDDRQGQPSHARSQSPLRS